MAKIRGSVEIPLRARAEGQPLLDWLYSELRSAILEGRMAPSTRLPATRDFAALHGVSRGTVVQVFERLTSEGYLHARVGAGTWVNARIGPRPAARPESVEVPEYIRRTIAQYRRSKAFVGLNPQPTLRPFRMGDVEFREFPSKLWSSIVSRRARPSVSNALQQRDLKRDLRGYEPLRQALAGYLGSSRGIACSADQIVIVSGVQQALDLLARLLLTTNRKIWMEDPGYFGARIAFENAGAEIVPVPVDDEGIVVSAGRKSAAKAAGAYVTPAHQFPLGPAMTLARRMDLLKWASDAGAFVIEDDYDSEFRFEGRPIPALMSLDRNSNVILVGSFSKLLFPALRIGYIAAPAALADIIVAFRARTDFRAVHFEQAVLADFMEQGHLGRHLRRLREIYAGRYTTLIEGSRRYLAGVLDVPNVQCGLYSAGRLRNQMSSSEAEAVALAGGVETLSLDRCTLSAPDPRGLLLGFAAFTQPEILAGLRRLAKALA